MKVKKGTERIVENNEKEMIKVVSIYFIFRLNIKKKEKKRLNILFGEGKKMKGKVKITSHYISFII